MSPQSLPKPPLLKYFPSIFTYQRPLFFDSINLFKINYLYWSRWNIPIPIKYGFLLLNILRYKRKIMENKGFHFGNEP